MKKHLIFIVLIISFYSCKKDDPAPDLNYLCNTGGIWLINNTDSFKAQSALDSFSFNQGGGYHSFSFTNSPVNHLQIEVFAKPDSGKSMVYKKMFIRNVSGKYITEVFTYENLKDSVLTITNNGDHYLVSMNPTRVKIGTKRELDFRICKMKMNDINP